MTCRAHENEYTGAGGAQQQRGYCQECYIRMEHSIHNYYVHLRNEIEMEGGCMGWERVEIGKAKNNLVRAEWEEGRALRELCGR
jgi:hypothetical protein